MTSKSVSQIFNILFQTGDIVFFLRGVFFSRYVQLKSSFLKKKTSVVESGTNFIREATVYSRSVGPWISGTFPN